MADIERPCLAAFHANTDCGARTAQIIRLSAGEIFAMAGPATGMSQTLGRLNSEETAGEWGLTIHFEPRTPATASGAGEN
jgi:hypothetical protein